MICYSLLHADYTLTGSNGVQEVLLWWKEQRCELLRKEEEMSQYNNEEAQVGKTVYHHFSGRGQNAAPLWMLGNSARLNGLEWCGQQGFKSIENYINRLKKSPDGRTTPISIIVTKSDLVVWEVVNCCRTAASASAEIATILQQKSL